MILDRDVVEGRFAGAVAAEQGHDLTWCDVEAHAPENLDDAVPCGDVANLKHAQLPCFKRVAAPWPK